MTIKKVTVITPSYMQGVFIGDCICSVIKQIYPAIEHIIVDALSTDQTLEVINDSLQRDGYQKVLISEKDSGPADAINKGLDLATGDIVCWLNADDVFFDQNVLNSVVSFFELHPGVDVITGDGYHIDDSGAYVSPIKPSYPSLMTYDALMYRDPFLQPSTFWRRNSLRLNKNYKYVFDWQFFIDMYTSGLNWVYLPEYFACYRLQSNSLTLMDKAERRLEVYQMACRNKRSVLQKSWCYFVYAIYIASEKTGVNALKMLVGKFNKLVGAVSFGKIYSS
jgi:glycosyltransferase involved in cell wall biosynthesis